MNFHMPGFFSASSESFFSQLSPMESIPDSLKNPATSGLLTMKIIDFLIAPLELSYLVEIISFFLIPS